MSGEGRLLVLAVSSRGGWEGGPVLSVVRAQILLGAPPSPPRHLPEAYLLIPSLWGLHVNMSFGGQRHSGDSSTLVSLTASWLLDLQVQSQEMSGWTQWEFWF